MKFSIAGATVLFLLMVAGPSGAQPLTRPAPPPVPQFGLPTPSVFTSKIGFFTSERIDGASYPRVIQLKIGPQKGTLLATFARRGPLLIFRSTDNGDSWQQFSEVPMLEGEPCLYELPVKMGEFPAGTVMACGGSLAGKTPGQRSLDVAVSPIATGGIGRYDPMDRAGLSRDQAPVFEPYLFADAQNRLVAYFSDERDKKSGYSQLLDHEVSTDGGKNWGSPVYDVAIPDGLSRPGMAIVTRDGKGKFYMSYELVSAPGYALEPRTNSVHFRTSADGVNWGDAKGQGILVQDRWRQFPNGTPYIVWSPWGGADGTLLVTGRSVVRDEIGRVGQGMFVNQHGGEGLWSLIETPIDYNVDGYSQTMLPLGDGREILQLVSVNSRIEYAKFELPEKLPTYGFPWDNGPANGPR
jgi:hypothetical protein